MCPGPAPAPAPRKGCMKKDGSINTIASGSNMKKVFFDEVMIKEYPTMLGDHPAVSSGAPITIGWKPLGESVIDLDFYEYCRGPERRTRKKMILSVRRRANCLLSAGYSLEQIANATLEAERTKKLRAESLRGSGWNNPFELLTGAVETTGAALKRVDVGSAAGAVVGAGAAVTNVAGKAVGNTIRASVTGVNTVIGVGSDMTISTGKMLVSGMGTSSRAVTGVASNVAGGVVGAGKIVAKPMVGAGKVVAKPVGKVVSTTGRTVSNVVCTTGRAISSMVSPRTAAYYQKQQLQQQQELLQRQQQQAGAVPPNDMAPVQRRNSLPIIATSSAQALEGAAAVAARDTIGVQ